MPKIIGCHSVAELQRLMSQSLKLEQIDELAGHLEACEKCAAVVDEALSKDTLSDALRSRETLSELPRNPVVETLIQKLRKLSVAANQQNVTVAPAASSADGGASLSASLRVNCPGCGKALKVKAELAGKKVRCPGCKQAVPVPLATRAVTPAEEMQTVAPRKSLHGATESQASRSRRHDSYAFLAPAQSADEIGRLGTYRVLKVLGAGGMGVVFQAEDSKLKRQVALKAMLPALAASDSASKRFIREAQAMAAVEHDHIVRVYQVGEDSGIPFIAMEFLHGEPLDKYLERRGTLPLSEVLRIGREMAEGLHAAHARGLIHRDIKPANVWLEIKNEGSNSDASSLLASASFRTKILDFGLARAANEEGQLTQQGAIVGTPAYMAPEQAAGQPLDHRTDLWSLGVVLYRLTTGQMPFRGTDTISTLMAVSTENPKSPRICNPECPVALSVLVMHLLAKRPENRVASARAVADALSAVSQQTISAPASHSVGSRPRKRWAVWLSILGFLAACAVAGVIILRLDGGEGEFHVRVEDDSVAVALDKEGGLTLVDRKTGARFRISAKSSQKVPKGDYDLVVADQATGFEFSAREFTIRGKDSKASVHVSFKKSDASQAKITVPLDSPKKIRTPFHDLKSDDILEMAKAPRVPKKLPAEIVAILGSSTMTDYFPSQQVSFSPDGKWILSQAQAEGDVYRLRDASNGTSLRTFRASGAAFAPDGRLVLSQQSGGIFFHDTITGEKTGSMLEKVQARGFQFSETGDLLAVVETDAVRIWSVATGKEQTKLEGLAKAPQGGAVASLAFHPDGKRLATGTFASEVILWDVATGKKIGEPFKHPQQAAVSHVVFSPKGDELASLCTGEARVWDLKTQKLRSKFYVSVHYYFAAIAYVPKSDLLASCGHVNPIRLWDTKTGKVVKQLPDPEAVTSADEPRAGMDSFCLAFSKDGTRMVSGGGDLEVKIRVWDVQTGGLLAFSAGPSAVLSLDVRPDSKQFATGHADGTVRIWDVAKRKVIRVLQDLPGVFVISVRYSADGKTLAAGSNYGGRVALWNAEDGTFKSLFETPGNLHCYELAFSRDSKKLAVGLEGSVFVFQVSSGDRLHQFPLPICHALAFDPEGKRLAVATAEANYQKPRLLVFDLEAEKTLFTTALPNWDMPGIWFSLDGQEVFGSTSSAEGRTCIFWDPLTGMERRRMKGFVKAVTADGKKAFGLDSSGGSTTFFNLVTGARTGRFYFSCEARPTVTRGLALTPDGEHALLADRYGLIYVLRLVEEAAAREVR